MSQAQPKRGPGRPSAASVVLLPSVAQQAQQVQTREQQLEEARPPPVTLTVPQVKPLESPTDEQRLRLRDNLQAIMFGCGDTIQSDPAAVSALEASCLQFLKALIFASAADNLGKVAKQREAALEGALQADENAAMAAQAGDTAAMDEALATGETARRTLPPRLSHANVLAALKPPSSPEHHDGERSGEEPPSARQTILSFTETTVEANQRLRKRLVRPLGGAHEGSSQQTLGIVSPQVAALSGLMKPEAWQARAVNIGRREQRSALLGLPSAAPVAGAGRR